MNQQHKFFIRKSFEIAERAVRHGDHPFGALLVLDGEIVCSAENRAILDSDVTNHAERLLISRVSRELDSNTLGRCTLYSSTEPCVMCVGAILAASLQTVVYGCSQKKLVEIAGQGVNVIIPSRDLFRRSNPDINVLGPLLEEEAARIHSTYWPMRLRVRSLKAANQAR